MLQKTLPLHNAFVADVVVWAKVSRGGVCPEGACTFFQTSRRTNLVFYVFPTNVNCFPKFIMHTHTYVV